MISILLHTVLMAALGYFGFQYYQSRKEPPVPPPAMPIKLTQVEQKPGEDPSIDERELRSKVDREIKRIESIPAERKLQTVQKNTRWLDQNSNEKNVAGVLNVTRNAFGGTPQRAYAPLQIPPAGEFDIPSMLPYSDEKYAGADGIERTLRTWVDKDGRTMKQTRRNATLPDGRKVIYQGAFTSDGTLHESEIPDDGSPDNIGRVLDQINQSPLLRKIYLEGVLPILEARRQAKPKPASPTPLPAKAK